MPLKNKSPIEITFGLLKMNVDIRIRMRGSNVLESESFAIGLQLVTGSEGLLRQGLRG